MTESSGKAREIDLGDDFSRALNKVAFPSERFPLTGAEIPFAERHERLRGSDAAYRDIFNRYVRAAEKLNNAAGRALENAKEFCASFGIAAGLPRVVAAAPFFLVAFIPAAPSLIRALYARKQLAGFYR